MIDLDNGTGCSKRRLPRQLFHAEYRTAGDVEWVEDVHNLELGLGLSPLLNFLKDFIELRQAGFRSRPFRILQSIFVTYGLGQCRERCRLSNYIAVSIRVGFPAFASHNPTGLAST